MTKITPRLIVQAPVVFDFAKRPPLKGDAENLVILLHGFNETGPRLLEKLDGVFSENSLVIAPNSPFPIPYKTDEGYKLGYTWYFYDAVQDEYFIDMSTALETLNNAVNSLGLERLPKIIIGFSQGGYLAPFAAGRLSHVTRVIGIGCEYLVDEWPKFSSPLIIDAIHGEKDEVVSLKSAHASFDRYVVTHPYHHGQFYALKGVNHRIDEHVRLKVKELLSPHPNPVSGKI